MEILCLPIYSTFQTILMAADDKPTQGTHLALNVKMMGQSRGKRKGKGSKVNKGKKSCTYCLKSSHTEDEWWVKKAANYSKEKDDALKEETEETGLVACVMNMGSTHLPPLCPFVA